MTVHLSLQEPIGVALVGAGKRGLGTHVKAIAAMSLLKLSSVVDTAAEMGRLRRVTDGLGVPIYAEVGLWNDVSRPDLAVIATPPVDKVHLAISLLHWKVPVLLEKTPAMSGAEFRRLIDASDETGVGVAILTPARYMTQFRPLLHYLACPSATRSDIEIRMDVPFYAGIGAWRMSGDKAGGGVLFDLGYHVLDLVVSRLGQPTSVTAVLAGDAPHDVDSEAEVWLHYDARDISIHVVLRALSNLTERTEIFVHGAPLKPDLTAHGAPHSSVTATVAQVNGLIGNGFLSGAGPWRSDLDHHLGVMILLERLYACAEWSTKGRCVTPDGCDTSH